MAGTSLATWHYDVDCLSLGHFGEGTFASPRHLDPARMHLVTRIQTLVLKHLKDLNLREKSPKI